jgi:hypothetical protein
MSIFLEMRYIPAIGSGSLQALRYNAGINV